MRDANRAQALADIGFVHQHAAVVIGSVKLNAQGTGKGGLRITGVGAGVM